MHIENFKSIDKADIELDKFTLVIGANAAGNQIILVCSSLFLTY